MEKGMQRLPLHPLLHDSTSPTMLVPNWPCPWLSPEFSQGEPGVAAEITAEPHDFAAFSTWKGLFSSPTGHPRQGEAIQGRAKGENGGHRSILGLFF